MTPKDGQKQASLHTFFRRKTPSPDSPAKTSSNGSPTSRDRQDAPRVITIFQDESDEDDFDIIDVPPSKRLKLETPLQTVTAQNALGSRTTSVPGSNGATRTSSYFGSSAARPAFRKKSITHDAPPLASAPLRNPSSDTKVPSAPRTPTVSVLQQYRHAQFPSSGAGDPTPEAGPSNSQRTSEQQRRHEAWQKRMQDPGGLIRRRRSLALDEAAAAEARRAAGGEDAAAADETPLDTPTGEDPPQGVISVDSDDERAAAAEKVGSRLAKYVAKSDDRTGDKAGGKAKGRGKKKEEEVGPSGQTYTPLEKQFMEIKQENPDVLLLMEVGYKYKFHGEDAKIASRELGIAAFPARNFYTASIPTHRLHIHVKKLISLGYKVGVISQMETAALKKIGENRNAPFTRELTHLFTAATYVEDPSLGSGSTLLDDPTVPGTAPPPTNALVALTEMGMGGLAVDDRVRIGLVSVTPGTGEVVWDEFDDSQVRSELETRLTHLSPAELLLPTSGLSKATEKVLAHVAGNTRTSATTSVRVERVSDVPTYSEAFDALTRFYRERPSSRTDNGHPDEIDLTREEEDVIEADGPVRERDRDIEIEDKDPIGLAAGLPSEEAVLALVDFPKQVVVALAILVSYMKRFKLEGAFRHRSSFTKFINRAHMLLSSNTLVNLYVRAAVHGSQIGRYIAIRPMEACMVVSYGHTHKDGTPVDAGMDRSSSSRRRARADAIEEIMQSNTYHMEKLRGLLVNMPDLIKGLTRIQYGKATASEVANILIGLNRVGGEFPQDASEVFRSVLLNTILKTLPSIYQPAKTFLDAVNIKAARDEDLANLWNDVDKFPEVQDAKDCIGICESELDQHLKEVRKILRRPALAYVTVAGIEYLVEVPIKEAKTVPPKWVKVQATRHVVRFHTPDVLRIAKEREQHKEILAAAAKKAFLSFQADISECHSLITVSRQLAVVDCLMSLAQVAASAGYCKPEFVAEPELHIQEGRHPMVEMLREEAYVPFDIAFSKEDGCAKVITGPNMAGKSSCVRATALIVCMAQIGSFVPAKAVRLGIHDAVQTRMGASDEIGRGKSTFMVELSETSDILRTLTPRTLVILDELGRGTSTYDGVAIAYATLSHVAGIGCNTLFVTHYPVVAEELAKEFPATISNWHMSFSERKLADGSAEITFLYRLTRGLAEASFGVWCARLAGLPQAVLETAQVRADLLKTETEARAAAALAARSKRLLDASLGKASGKRPAEVVRAADALLKALRLHGKV